MTLLRLLAKKFLLITLFQEIPTYIHNIISRNKEIYQYYAAFLYIFIIYRISNNTTFPYQKIDNKFTER